MGRFPCALILAVLASCTGKLTEPPEVASEREQGSTELVFMLDDQQFAPNGCQSFTARGLLEGRRVGFGVELQPWSENGPGFVNMSTWECKARLLSRGSESDLFLQHIDLLYRAQVPAPRMAESIECKAMSMWEHPGKLDGEPVKLLLLFSGGFDETLDAEVWLEVRPKEARVIWREKDPRLRAALIQALVEHAE